jgi:hypothetical protein
LIVLETFDTESSPTQRRRVCGRIAEEETMRTVALGDTGIQVSRLSFGTAFMGPLSDHLSPQEGAALLLQALDQGISFWDTSDDYGTHPHVACAFTTEHLTRASWGWLSLDELDNDPTR